MPIVEFLIKLVLFDFNPLNRTKRIEIVELLK